MFFIGEPCLLVEQGFNFFLGLLEVFATFENFKNLTGLILLGLFDQQLAVNAYWEQLGGTVMLPGTNRAADRFARASFYVNAIPKSDDTRIALASVLSVVRNVSVPFGIYTPDELACRLCGLFNGGKQQKKLGNMTPQAFLEALRP